ncbi:hypothetical protein [Nocardia huaxiensis]|uniref:hypothetical protein n=1 Tax=Nocardia huaxiensis TaxID=2755382 RepID=UPI001E4658C7|nr:hypothetical protein [Nocardia huaxiensis]UFS95503.1 hypothetical protein LPY97_33315 [Nocardia huaxiensis]
MAGRTVVLIAAQAVLDGPGYRSFPALQVTDADPGHLLSVTTVIDGQQVWIDTAGGWLTVRRSLLAECLGALPSDALASLDARITATLGHPN